MKKLTLIFFALLLVSPLSAQELLVVFAANLDNTGGLNGSDNSGADLYRVRFNPQTPTVTDLQRLTATSTDVEFFPATGVVDVTLAMYNEDNFPTNQQVYLTSRTNLIEFGKMLQSNNAPFNWESDWRFLNAVLQWDTPQVMASTNGKNLVRYLKEELGLSIDPHSHENQGYNYADVAHLIDSLGVTPTNVVGGHIWDPSESLYQNWERFKQPLKGNRFPWAEWKGDILMGSASGLHRNDPKPSGVWRPKDKYHFWEDDPNGNVHAVGQYAFGATVADVQEAAK